jgi:SSS family solute:Na+ symporter
MALIGMVAAVRFPGLEDSQSAFATVAVSLLPSGLAGVVLAASLSALMSTASGTLLASATVLASDVYRRFLEPDLDDARFLWTSRLLTGILGIGVVAVSLLLRDVITALDVAYTFLTGAVFMPVAAALFWKRATATGTLVSMCASALAATAAMIVFGPGSTPPIVVGLLTSFLTLVLVSVATPPPEAGLLRTWQSRLSGGASKSDRLGPPTLTQEKA